MCRKFVLDLHCKGYYSARHFALLLVRLIVLYPKALDHPEHAFHSH